MIAAFQHWFFAIHNIEAGTQTIKLPGYGIVMWWTAFSLLWLASISSLIRR